MKSIRCTVIASFFLLLPFGAQAQSEIDRVVPSCRGASHICRTVDFYSQEEFEANDIPTKGPHYAEALKDGRITIQEISLGNNPTAKFSKDLYREVMLSHWLELNGLDPNTNSSNWLPRDTVTVAVAKKSDPILPNVVPACKSGKRHQSCIDLSLSEGTFVRLFPDGIALYKLISWRDLPKFEEWLAMNGLQGTGITPFSLIDIPGDYSLRLF